VKAPAVHFFIFSCVALSILGVAAATDVLDGWIARKFDQQSDLGSYLDPLADKLMITVSTVSLGIGGLLPLPLVGLILVRDFTLAQGTAWHL
jgi:cardiolipin synthase